MKKIFYFLLLFVSIGYSQDVAFVNNISIPESYFENHLANADKLLAANDFISVNGRMQATAIPCRIQDANTIFISVVCMQNAFQDFGLAKINDMLLVANEKVRSSLPTNKLYFPKEIKMIYVPDSHDWRMTNAFSTLDVDGVNEECLLSIDFDSTGRFSVMKKIL